MTGVPAQTGFAEASIDTLTGRIGLTVMVTAFEAAGEPVAQGVILEVRIQVIISPVTGVKA